MAAEPPRFSTCRVTVGDDFSASFPCTGRVLATRIGGAFSGVVSSSGRVSTAADSYLSVVIPLTVAYSTTISAISLSIVYTAISTNMSASILNTIAVFNPHLSVVDDAG